MDVSDIVRPEELTEQEGITLIAFHEMVPDLVLEKSRSTGLWSWCFRCDESEAKFPFLALAIADFTRTLVEGLDEQLGLNDEDDEDEQYED